MSAEASTCEIKVGGARFQASASASGVVSLELPPLGEAVRSLAGKKPACAVVVGEAGGAQAAWHLQALAVFLAELLAGREPSAVPRVDLAAASPFTRQVLEVVYRPGAPCRATGRSPRWRQGPPRRAPSAAR